MLRTRRLRTAALLAPLSVLAFLAPGAARAENDPAAAQALFNDARQLMADGRWSEACPKLEESQKLDPGMGTQFNLANCYQHEGRVASAWALFLEVAAEARAAQQTAREKVARERATALEGTLPKLLVLVHGGEVSGLEVKRDGVPVGRGQWGMAVPVDPGSHALVATAPGHQEWRGAVDVPKTPGIVTIDVPALTASAPPAVAAAPAPTHAAPVETRGMTNAMPPEAEQPHRGNGQRITAAVVGLVGLGALATGTVFGLESKSKRDDASAHCNGNLCDPSGVSLRHDAVVDGNVSTVFFGVGAAAVVGSIVLWLTAPSSAPATTVAARPTERAVRAAPLVGQGVTGLTVAGSF